jgi:cell wall-associated NlpC family hydrolase
MPRLRLIIVLFVLALAGLCAKTALAAPKRQTRAEVGNQVARYARKFVGVRYRWGGMSPRSGFDCSGLVAFVYRHFGISLPHYTVTQFAEGRHVPLRRLRPGDLVFFSGLAHVGLYIGHGRFIHAPHTGARVRIESLRHGSWRRQLTGARRILKPGKALRTLPG